MAKIAELRDLVWRNLEGGFIPDDTRFTKREITLYVRGGISQALKEYNFELLNNSEFKYFSGYAKTTKKEVKTDPDTDLQYIDSPDKSLAIGGVRNYNISSANPFSRWAVNYVFIRQEEVLVGKLQPNVPNVIQCVIHDNKILFTNGTTTDKQVTLSQKLVIPDSDDDEFDIPEEIVSRAVSIAIMTAERELKPTDRAIDGTPLT